MNGAQVLDRAAGVKMRQGVVARHHIRVEFADGALELVLRGDLASFVPEAGVGEDCLHTFDIGRIVF
jgi:hypothetical protein